MSDKTEITATIGNRAPPTLARLRELLYFEPGIGLRWRVSRGSVTAGQRAGGVHHSGHERIGIDGASFRLDRIADLYRRGRHDDMQTARCPTTPTIPRYVERDHRNGNLSFRVDRGARIPLPKDPTTPEFRAAYSAALVEAIAMETDCDE
jgi:hypothetical protein